MRQPPAKASAGINQQVNFQGKLVNTNGTNVPDGTYNIEFKIYQDGNGCVGGGSSPCSGTLKWTEDWLRNNSQGVTVSNGIFQVNLGSITSLSAVDFNQSVLWLSINLGNTNATCTPFSSCSGDGEMLPFIRFTASPYALNSNGLQGLSASNFVQLAQGVQADGSTTNPSIFVNKTGATANILELQKGGSDVFTIGNTGNITATGTYNTDTLTGSALTFGSASTATIQSASSHALNITANAASTFSTTSGNLAITSASALNLNGAADSTFDVGNNTLSIQTTANGPITTGTGLLTVGGSQTFSGTTARVITGPTSGGLTVNDTGGNLTLSTTTSGTLAATSAGALNLTGAAASTFDIGNNTLSLQTTGNGPITTGTGLLTQGGNVTFNGTTARTITGPTSGGLTLNDTGGNLSLSTTTSGTLALTSAGNLNIGSVGSSTAASTVHISDTSSATGLQTVTIGSTAKSTDTTTIQGGTGAGAISLTPAAGGTIVVGSNDGTANLLVVDGDTATSDPAGVNGAIYYNTGGAGGPAVSGSFGGVFRCFEGNQWKDCTGLRDISERRWGYAALVGTSATSLIGFGIIGSTQLGQGTGTSVNNTESNYVNYVTSGGANAANGVGNSFSATATEAGWLPRVVARVRVDPTTVTSALYWVGLSSATLTLAQPVIGSTTAAGTHAGLAVSSSVNSSQWICEAANASNKTGVSTGVAMTAGHYYDAIVDMSVSGTLVCSVADNGGPYTTVTVGTNVPTSTALLGLDATITELATSATRNLGISYLYLDQN